MAHAKLSPSKADRWMTCSGSVAMCEGLPDNPSKAAAEGTAAHTLAAWALESGDDCEAYLGRSIVLDEPGLPDKWRTWEVTRDMARDVQVYVDAIRRLAAINDAQMFIELPVDITHLTGELDENGDPVQGTADAVVVYRDDLLVVLDVNDLKFGRGVVVHAERNRQMLMYASGAVEALRMMDMPDPDVIRVTAHQVRLGEAPTWECTMRELEDFRSECKARALLATAPDAINHLKASEKGCRFCPAKATCPEARAYAEREAMLEFDDLTTEEGQAEASKSVAIADYSDLSRMVAVEDFVIGLFKAARARVEAILLGGGEVPGFKLVRGRRAARAWSDAAAAEAALKAFRLKVEQMYEFTLISPTEAERLKKDGVIGPRQWPKLAEMITKPEGKLSIAPASDRREAAVIDPASDYDDVPDLNGVPNDLAD